jgi:hypothetical protein
MHVRSRGLESLRLQQKSGRAGNAVPQGLKPNVFSSIHGPTKVVP